MTTKLLVNARHWFLSKSFAYREDNQQLSESESWMKQQLQRLFGICTIGLARILSPCSIIIMRRIGTTATHAATNIDIGVFWFCILLLQT